ncbi:hypothetical protein Anapl_03698 [Anas platyrhynchos]|uniref:Uncharacterized protein n=1 Tax=Anas platyrhynchos TaxID=8839 RepID=R0M1E6_ANAPL|nr:hypothetical protein Anapl_03698 [Anas platyrhynchos]
MEANTQFPPLRKHKRQTSQPEDLMAPRGAHRFAPWRFQAPQVIPPAPGGRSEFSQGDCLRLELQVDFRDKRAVISPKASPQTLNKARASPPAPLPERVLERRGDGPKEPLEMLEQPNIANPEARSDWLLMDGFLASRSFRRSGKRAARSKKQLAFNSFSHRSPLVSLLPGTKRTFRGVAVDGSLCIALESGWPLVTGKENSNQGASGGLRRRRHSAFAKSDTFPTEILSGDTHSL